MNTTIVLVVVVVFAFVAGRLLQRVTGKWAAIPGGAGYLALGALVGPIGLNFVDQASLDHLQPLVSLLLGLLGFDVGLMLRSRMGDTSTLPARLLATAVVIGLVGGGIFAAVTLGFPEAALDLRISASATLGLAAAVASVSGIERMAAGLNAGGWVTQSLVSFALIGEVLAILGFGVVSAGVRAENVAIRWLGELTTTEWLASSAAVGLVCGLLFTAFIGRETASPRIFLATVGSVIFTSGMASGLGVSPLFVNLIAGATVALLSSRAQFLVGVVHKLEHPVLVVLLVLAGAMWSPAPLWLWGLVPLYVVLRFVGIRVGSALALTTLTERPPARGFGSGLMAPGAVSVAIAINLAQLQPSLAPTILTTLLVAFVVQEVLAGRLLRRVLGDAEEIGRGAEQLVDVSDTAAAEGVAE